jgi:Eco57I restriction-modification methylase
MQKYQRSAFSSIRSEGALLPLDILQRIAQFDTGLGGLTAEAYHHEGEKLNEVINEAWTHVLRAWNNFQTARAGLSSSELGTALTRERWLLPLFAALDYGRLYTIKPFEIEGKTYPISHAWQYTPIHLVGCNVDLDHMARSSSTGLRSSPYSLVQEFLNRSGDHLWGMVSNGLQLRLLRKNVSITRQAYIEFDLETIFQGENYADFVLLWLLCHQSRVEAERPADCWLEKWSRIAQEQGIRALNKLRDGVEQAINILGSGFLAHSSNRALRERLRLGELNTQDYYHQVLRMVYRLIVLFVAEDREVLFHPHAEEAERQRYTDYYSTERLRRLAEQRIGTRHSDLFQGLYLIMDKLGSDSGCLELGLPSLNGFLFSHKAIPDLVGCELTNHDLLEAVRSLAFTLDGRIRHIVDYKNLGPEELGSVYESLLEMHPEINLEAHTFELTIASGNERKTSGSYYTPTSLIDCLLDSALEPVLAEACAKPNPEKALLNLKVCDPACGSGHFLIAAAHRIAKRLAAVRTGNEEPGPEDRRTALRDVVGHCIYGVDINPMAVELCKVNLWMEAIEPGKPLSFLDAHIQTGNSLIGATPALLAKGIPDSAFEAIEGDDKKVCAEFKKRNRQQREGNRTLFDPEGQLWPWDRLGDFAASMMQLDEIADDTVQDIHRKQVSYEQLVQSSGYRNGRLWADAGCAAFVWKKTKEFPYPITEEVFRNIERNPFHIAPWMKDEIERLAKQYQFFHWHLAFPNVFRAPTNNEETENEQAGWSGGFDVVLGNPPWERTEFNEQEWFASRDPEIANAVGAVRKRKIVDLATHNPDLYKSFLEANRQEDGWSHFIRHSDRYPLCGRGRINTYAIFAETNRLILNPTGRIGCIVQSGIATDDTTSIFFRDLVETQTLVSLYTFENEAKLFPGIDHRVRFILLTITGKSLKVKNIDYSFGIYRVDDLISVDRHFYLPVEDFALFNPNSLTCPIFRSRRDAEITKDVYLRVPILAKENALNGNPWNMTFRQGIFNMTSSSHLFRSRKQLEDENWILKGNVFYHHGEAFLPLYEGKMIWLFDHRFGTYEGQTLAQARQGKLPELNEQQHKDPFLLPIPQHWVHESHMAHIINSGRKAFLAFRDVTNSVVLRTAIFCVIPIVPCGHKLPLLLIDAKYKREITYISTCFSSFILDYIARQKVGGTSMAFFAVKQLPIIPPDKYTELCHWDPQITIGSWIFPRALELTYTSWDLEAFAKDCGYDGPPFDWDEERRFLLRCELDAAYFHIYSINRNDINYIMDTFRVAKQEDEKQYSEYRTKRVILEIYDEMRRAIETCDAYRTWLDPPPADPSMAHLPRSEAMLEG